MTVIVPRIAMMLRARARRSDPAVPPPVGADLCSGYALPSPQPNRRLLTLIVAEF
jgi:hypothetical protein